MDGKHQIILKTRAARATFNSNQLKLIAIIAMVFDHCMIVFMPHHYAVYQFLRMPGKLTAPIMCFLIAEGYYHTSNLKKYMARLLIMSIVSYYPYVLCMEYNMGEFWKATDVMWSLLCGLAALAIYYWDIPILFKCGLIGFCCLLAYSADWNYIAVLLVLFFGIFHEEKNQQTAAHIAISGLYLLQGALYDMPSVLSRIGILFSIPLLRRYNGRRGKKSKLIQWSFYWFYPVHLLIIYFIKRIIEL